MVEQSPPVGILMLVCPDSGAEVSTHTLYSIHDLQRARAAKLLLYCPSCKKEHIFNFSDGRLDPVRSNDG
jgi:hypothetical protein